MHDRTNNRWRDLGARQKRSAPSLKILSAACSLTPPSRRSIEQLVPRRTCGSSDGIDGKSTHRPPRQPALPRPLQFRRPKHLVLIQRWGQVQSASRLHSTCLRFRGSGQAREAAIAPLAVPLKAGIAAAEGRTKIRTELVKKKKYQ